MEYDSASSCEGRLRDFETSEDLQRLGPTQKPECSTYNTSSTPWHSLQVVAPQPKFKLGTTNRSLSSQVMEYYHKYSQNANLDQYFSLPTTNASPETVKYYYSIYEVNSKLADHRQDCIGEEYNLRSCVPRERRRWVRPPLIGQSSNTESSSRYVQQLSNPETPSPDLKRVTPETILEEKHESSEILSEITERKVSSPTSSIASHKPLEWDSGADVGYFNILPNNKQSDKKLSTIERMALARGCSAALRLDPEGTTESGISGKLAAGQKSTKSSITPDANSTRLLGNASGSESEIEITPIVKNHLPGIITGSCIKSSDRCLSKDLKQQDVHTQCSKWEHNHDTPKSTFTFKVPFVKHSIEARKVTSKENVCPPMCPLKKSTSMNTLVAPASKLSLKRSQSELNLYAKDKNKAALPLIFNSSSSISTIVNKPSTCDKVIQTSLNAYTQESVGVQVSVLEEEKAPLPKRGTSLQKSFTVILKNETSGTYKVPTSRKQGVSGKIRNVVASEQRFREDVKQRPTNSEPSRNGSARQTPQLDDTENITGRANSFEYFPGHVYENVPNGSGSHLSSSETEGSHSTLPNTSSSINEKLWGDSDSLVKDLERSVSILKSLVDANKCDKEVKKRLIHHVVKRLITAKYTEDKIEHGLEDNVPWNPDDARHKVYGADILEALTKKHNTSDSSADWNPQKGTTRDKSTRIGRGIMKDTTLGSSSDKMDKNTDRTETDGRKARMGLRLDDCRRSSNTLTDPDKSESSDCFFPQRGRKGNKVQDLFCAKERCKLSQGDSSTTNTTPPDHNRMLLDAVVNNRKTGVRSSNNTEEQVDWRLLTTFSERQFELKKYSNSDSRDSKLVSYAEMEKRNQLVWITNEISHLCNLKKLLEEPRRSERLRQSPKKSKSANCRAKPVDTLLRMHELSKANDYSQTNGSNARANSTVEPWSSHCNLATCQANSRANSIIQRVKKRNSSAQTATNVTGAHSKTGGEIVSASSMHNCTLKLVNVGVQTVPQEPASALPTLIQSEIVHYIKCPAHDAVHFQNSCKCAEQSNQCLKHHAIQNVLTTCVHCLQEQKDQSNRNQKVYHSVAGSQEDGGPPVVCQTYTDQVNSLGSSDPIPQHCVDKEVQTTSSEQKEAKNQINASRSKSCDCRCEAKKLLSKECRSCFAQVIMEASGVISKCEECQKKVSCAREKEDLNTKQCSCTTAACECENSLSRKGRAAMRSSGVKYCQDNNGHVPSFNQNNCIKLCECSNDCSCENSRKVEAYNARAFCGCHPNGKTEVSNGARCCGHWTEIEDRSIQMQPYRVGNRLAGEASQHKVQNDLKCNCERDCLCNGRAKMNEDASHGTVCANARSNHLDEEKEHNSDSGRNSKYCCHCGVTYQNIKKCSCNQSYPKAVAYELSFSIDYDRKYDNSAAVQKVPLPSRTVNGTKIDGCVCNMIRKKGPSKSSTQKNTLQDYLSKNKADFVTNAETRRQYLSEISHLRQLRKEKRIQLLAMASTSNFTKSWKTGSKSTVITQRKISDQEIRERLRKRYLRLNEVRQKKRLQQKQEEARRNKLMAKIFCKKLQQKVLRGQVDLSQSISVISNI